MSIGDIIVVVGISIAVIAAMYVLIRGKKKGSSCCNCGGGCTGCTGQSLLKLVNESENKKD